jgi:2-hydroxycyclohexanecarboxyl-CoA dehydrogenase
MSLQGRVAIVTGAGSGIGRAIALGLAADGAHVAVAEVDVAGAEQTADSIRHAGGRVTVVQADITDEAAVDRMLADIGDALGQPRILVNNAGWDVIQPFIDNERSFIRKVVNINLIGHVLVTQSFVKGLIALGGGGRVVNIASDAGRVGSTGETVYAGAKGGLIGFTKSLAREMARYEITVNCVCPGPTDTPLFQRQPERIKEALVRAIPFRRLAQPDDVAHAVRFFASDQAAYITGQILSVSGGLTMAG